MNNLQTFQSSSYCVFTFTSDDLRRTEIPVGIALWAEGDGAPVLRLAASSDRLKDFKREWFPYLQMVQSQVGAWMKDGKLPYGSSSMEPRNNIWWEHLRNLMVHRVKLSAPRAIDCRDVGEEADLLYEAIVQPDRSNLEKKQRVDQAINESLGKLSRQFTRGTVSGYMGRAVPVKRFYENNQSLLILDGVNLASQDAEKEADALVSRLQRIYAARGGQERRSVTACVGYLTSPGGLNGEAALVEWIRERGKAETFDLIRQKEEFAGTVESALSDFSLSSEE